MKSINKILIFSANVLLSFFILALVYSLVYSKFENSLKGKAVIYEDFHKVDEKLSKYDSIKESIDKQKGEILEQIHIYQDFMYSNEQNAGSYKSKIVKVLNKMGISEKEKQKNGALVGNASFKFKNGVTQIEMTANYEQLCRFLFELEKFSVVQELRMDYKNNVSLKCIPVQYSKDVDDYFNDRGDSNKRVNNASLEAVSYFEEVVNKTQNLKNDIGKIPTWEDFKPLPRSPFYKYDLPKVSAGGKVYYNGPVPNISMDGIMYDAVDPIVIIGGKFYHLGDVYKGAKIVKVNESSMQVDFNGKIYTYRMKY